MKCHERCNTRKHRRPGIIRCRGTAIWKLVTCLPGSKRLEYFREKKGENHGAAVSERTRCALRFTFVGENLNTKNAYLRRTSRGT